MIFAILITQKQWNNSKQNKRIKEKPAKCLAIKCAFALADVD